MAGDGDDRAVRHGRRSLRLGTVLGVEIRLHWTFLALVMLVVLGGGSSGLPAVASGLLWIVAVFGSVLLHELAHSVWARRRNVGVDGILLTPLGGLSQLRELPRRPKDELTIALVGPLASVALALVAFGAGLASGSRLWPPTLFAGPWITRIAWLNVLLGGFNLLPALPMDGGRVLRAALAGRLGRKEATKIAARVARVLAAAMIAVGLLYDVWLALIGILVLLGAGAEEDEAGRDHGPPGPAGSAGADPDGLSGGSDAPR